MDISSVAKNDSTLARHLRRGNNRVYVSDNWRYAFVDDIHALEFG